MMNDVRRSIDASRAVDEAVARVPVPPNKIPQLAARRTRQARARIALVAVAIVGIGLATLSGGGDRSSEVVAVDAGSGTAQAGDSVQVESGERPKPTALGAGYLDWDGNSHPQPEYPDGAGPYPDAPLCESHDAAQAHDLWDPSRSCHFDHTHNADPALGDDMFGPAGSLWPGDVFEYPWRTANERERPDGFKVAVGLDLGCGLVAGADLCLTDYRLLYWEPGDGRSIAEPERSFFIDARVCEAGTDPLLCGVVRSGGVINFGDLYLDFERRIDNVEPDPGSGSFRMLDEHDRTGAPGSSQLAQGRFESGPGRAEALVLRSVLGTTSTQTAQFSLRVYDVWGGQDPDAPGTTQLYCGDGSCRFNASEHLVYHVSVRVETGNAGGEQLSTFTDPDGQISRRCAQVSAACIPYVVEAGAPQGLAVFESESDFGWEQGVPDFDTSPVGEWWIRPPG